MQILFIDDRMDEVMRQWERSGCSQEHQLFPLEPFQSIEQVCAQVQIYRPDVIVIGHGLGAINITGVDVINALRNQGYDGYVIANSGGGSVPFAAAGITVNGSADRQPKGLRNALATIEETDR